MALRPVVWAAKQIASLQRLSGDRVLLGVGTGGPMHGKQAWRAMEVPYGKRAARTDAALSRLPDLVRGKATALDADVIVALEPPAAMPPVWIGGTGSHVVLRRSLDRADRVVPVHDHT